MKIFSAFGVGLLFFSQSVLAQQNSIKISVVQKPSVATTNSWYASNKKPLEPLYFIKLPVGSIKPEGWILKYLELQRDGLTGQLGEISAWLDKNNNAWFSGNGMGDHGWEEVPYWLKGYGNLGYLLNDKKIIAETKSWLEKVFQSQTPDGYFGPRVIANDNQGNKRGVPDLWPNMIMLWCMQFYCQQLFFVLVFLPGPKRVSIWPYVKPIIGILSSHGMVFLISLRPYHGFGW